MTVMLDQLAGARAGYKGDTLLLAVFPRGDAAHDLLAEHLTAEAVAAHFRPLVTGPARRSLLPSIPAMVFVLPGVLGEGVTGGATLYGHGKTLSYHLLTLELPVG